MLLSSGWEHPALRMRHRPLAFSMIFSTPRLPPTCFGLARGAPLRRHTRPPSSPIVPQEEQLIEALSPAPGATRYVSATNPLVLGGLDSGWHFYPKLYLNKGHLGGETVADGISAEALSAPPVLAPAL
jgi:hypothetical protein